MQGSQDKPKRLWILLLYCWINSAAYLTVLLYFLCICSFGNTFLSSCYVCWGLPPWAAFCCLSRWGCAGARGGCLLTSQPSLAFHKGLELVCYLISAPPWFSCPCPQPLLNTLALTSCMQNTADSQVLAWVSKWAMSRGAASAKPQSQQFPGLTSPPGLQGLSFQ